MVRSPAPPVHWGVSRQDTEPWIASDGKLSVCECVCVCVWAIYIWNKCCMNVCLNGWIWPVRFSPFTNRDLKVMNDLSADLVWLQDCGEMFWHLSCALPRCPLMRLKAFSQTAWHKYRTRYIVFTFCVKVVDTTTTKQNKNNSLKK